MAGAPPPLPSSRPKGAYVPPPVPSNRPKVAYVHPLPPTTPEPTHVDLDMKANTQTGVINTNGVGSGEVGEAPSHLGRQLQAALQNRMMNNLNEISGRPQPPGKPASSVESVRPMPAANKPHIASKPPAQAPAPTTTNNRPLSYSSFGDLFGSSTTKTSQPQHQPQHAQQAPPTSSFNQLSAVFGSSSSKPAESNLTLSATSEQKKAAANYSWNVAKDASKNVSAKDLFSAGSLLVSAHSNKGNVSASKEQQAALGRISTQVGKSAAKNVTAEEIGHATNFATTNIANNAQQASREPGNQQSSFDLLAQVMGSKGGGLPPSPNPSARARPKPLQSNNPSQANMLTGLPPPPSPTPRQKVAPQPHIHPPRAAPRAPPPKSTASSSSSRPGSSLIDFDPLATPAAKAGPPGLPKAKAQGPAGARTKPTIIRPNTGSNSRSASPAVELQQKKSRPPPRPMGPPSKKQAPDRPNAVQGTRSAGSTPPRPSGLQPKRKAPPRPGSQKGKKMAPGAPAHGRGGKKENLPPRPGPGHPLFNKYMGSEPHGMALFDYQGQEADELSFKTDDTIILVKRIDADWLVGKCGNKQGMFPSQFIKIVKDLEAQPVEEEGPQAVALFGFQASAPDEISFDEGNVIKLIAKVGTVWFRGEVHGKTGIFPSNHVEVIIPLPSTGGASPSPSNISSGPRCIAKFDYASDSPDDLNFSEGATIRLTQRVGSEWYRGELEGKSGIFPSSFVEVIEDIVGGASSNRSSPTTGNEVRAMYDFDGADSTELTFKEGDKITVSAQVGADWLEGELNGKKGRFPASFVDRVPTSLPQASNPGSTGEEPHCVVSFDFEAAAADEITLKAGERVLLLERIGDDWLRGKVDAREGIFPRSFVDVVIDLPCAGGPTPSSAKALFDFDAEAADELSFKVGNVIKITERVNDEWLQGSLAGKTGKFPAAFVELSS